MVVPQDSPPDVSDDGRVEEGQSLTVPIEGRVLVPDPSGAAPTGGTPLPDIVGAVSGDDGSGPVALGTIDVLPGDVYLDFLSELCGESSCFRDAAFKDVTDPSFVSGPYESGRAFNVRHGFVNDGPNALGEGFDVVLYTFPMDEPGEMDGPALGSTTRYTSDYVIRGETESCGPGYRIQDSSVTCEWFVHDFPDGLPDGRHALWAFWEAPCSAWRDLGFVGSCADPDEVLSLFSSGVDSPFGGEASQGGFGGESMGEPGGDSFGEDSFEVDGSGSLPTSGTPLPDIAGAVPGDDGLDPLPLSSVATLPGEDRLDFLFEFCGGGACFRDGHFMDPNDPLVGSGPFASGRPFHVRHGFVNNSAEPLGPGFDVKVYVFPFDGEVGETQVFTSDYVIRGETDQCGPTYKSQSDPVTCEWFVHDFSEGLPSGRFALWAFWEAPCAAWLDMGFAETCANPDEVLSLFSSGFDSPFDEGDIVHYEEVNESG